MESVSPALAAFVSELRALGYAREVNLDLDVVSAEGRPEKYPELATALAGRNPDVIIVTGSQMAVATKKVTSKIPIVMSAAGDPVKYGLVATLAKPGGNVTGISADADPQIEVRRLQLLREAVPSLTRVSCLGSLWIWNGPYGQELRRSRDALGLQVQFAELVPSDLHASFDRVKAQQPDALFVLLTPEAYTLRQQITDFAAESRLPMSAPYAEMAVSGALMSYGFSIPGLWRLTASYVDKILKGTKPADLPVQLPNKFELIVNQKTAKTLGIKIPQRLLLRADRVIE